jgi:FHA domain
MQVILQITAGPSVGRKIRVHPDRITQCGKSIKADVGFPHDEAMSDIHFEISFPDNKGRIRDCGGSGGTLLNGQLVEGSQPLRDLDEITAGRTTVQVKIDQTLRASPSAVAAAAAAAEVLKHDTALVYCKPLELSDDARKRMDDQIKVPAYIELLAGAGLLDDAIKVLGYHLKPRVSVWWGWECVRKDAGEQLKPDDLMAFNAAYDWIVNPLDPVRRTAHQCAENAKMQGAGSWIAMAAFWSGDSLMPPNLPKVPPAPTLAGQAVSVALTIAATLVPRAKADAIKRAWIQHGLELSRAAEIEWPKPARGDGDQAPSRG